MSLKSKKISLFVLFLVIISGCSKHSLPPQPDQTSKSGSSCYIMYDAGSSGTRLYIYEKQGNEWIKHEGPKVSALADPVREIRGKLWKDVDAVTTEVVSALDDIRHDGPIHKNGRPEWKAFDWETKCHVISAKIYATAGMRIAEQENPDRSSELWKKLKQKLATKFQNSIDIDARTLSGYEEGLYAWLAVKESENNNDFGIVEMGGASSQITFPCLQCDATDDAVKTIMIKDAPVQVYSYSFLGLGQDEAYKNESLGFPEPCAYAIGTIQAGWKPEACADQIVIRDGRGIRDPYNFQGKNSGIHNRIPLNKADVQKWVLTGAFNYTDDSKIDNCCLNKGECYSEKFSCFQAVYLKKYLQELNVPYSSKKMDASWTFGAVICAADNCLQQATTPVCRWMEAGDCLD